MEALYLTHATEVEAMLALVAAGDTSVVPVLQDAIESGVAGAGKTIYVVVTAKARKFRGQAIPARREDNSFAVIVPGKSIRLVGTKEYYGNDGKVLTGYDRTFKLGEIAEYASHSLSFYGKIVGISGKTVQILKGDSHRAAKASLSIYDFNWRNYHFDFEAAQTRNHNWMD